jgi:hypothetical protein
MVAKKARFRSPGPLLRSLAHDSTIDPMLPPMIAQVATPHV